MELPRFTYHPDPISTGSIIESGSECLCCGDSRGFIYRSSVYGALDVEGESFCPWCIADGRAAREFDVTFNDDYPLGRARIAKSILNEVAKCTPGYDSWQQEEWQAHCNDACEFHGDLPKSEVANPDAAAWEEMLRRYEMPDETWQYVAKHYEPGGGVAIYKFICRHCGKCIYSVDLA